MDRKQLSMFKEWFADAFPDCKDYLELTYFDAEQNTFLSKCSYNPDSGNAAKVLRTVLGSWQHQQAKMEELQVQLKGAQERAQLVLQYKDKYRLERDDLQKRVEILEATLESERWDREAGFKVFFKARDIQGQWHGFERKPEFYEVGGYWWKGGGTIYLYGDEYCDRETAINSLTAIKEQALKGEGNA